MAASKSSQGKTSTLVEAARALEQEVVRYESSLAELARTDIVSEKTLQRAAKSLESCAQHQNELARLLTAFAAAMGEMKERQERCVAETNAGAERVKARFESRAALLARVGALGAMTGEIIGPMASASATDGAEPEGITDVLARLDGVTSKAEEVIAEAEAVRQAAKAEEWQDVERDADALRQQLQAAKNKVLNAQRALAERAPS